MVAKIAFVISALAIVRATALVHHGTSVYSRGTSAVARQQDGFGNFAYRHDVESAAARSTHAAVGSTVGGVVAAPPVYSAPAVVAAPPLFHAPVGSSVVASHAASSVHSAVHHPAVLAGPAPYAAYGTPFGLGLGAGINRAHGLGYGPGVLHQNVVGLGAGYLIR